MTIRLLLISHAATSATRRARFPVDEPIEAAAATAARELGPSLSRAGKAWRAPERRAGETAAALGMEASLEPLLSDIDLGRWAGQSFESVLDAEPQGVAQWTADTAAAPHGGESVEALIGRVVPWLEAQRDGAGRISAVTHPAVIRAAIVVALGAPPAAFWRIDIAPLAQVDLRSDGRRWTLRGIATP